MMTCLTSDMPPGSDPNFPPSSTSSLDISVPESVSQTNSWSQKEKMAFVHLNLKASVLAC